eukprot:1699028-Rhodomonas_salina.6
MGATVGRKDADLEPGLEAAKPKGHKAKKQPRVRSEVKCKSAHAPPSYAATAPVCHVRYHV